MIYAVDPGTRESALVILRGDRVEGWVLENPTMVVILGEYARTVGGASVLVLEQVESYGMAVGRETFETVHWGGRFHEAWAARALPVVRMPRRDVKLALCGSARATDANIRAALLDRFGGAAAVGTKKAPGPLYGVKSHMWAALALAVTYQLQEALPPC